MLPLLSKRFPLRFYLGRGLSVSVWNGAVCNDRSTYLSTHTCPAGFQEVLLLAKWWLLRLYGFTAWASNFSMNSSCFFSASENFWNHLLWSPSPRHESTDTLQENMKERETQSAASHSAFLLLGLDVKDFFCAVTSWSHVAIYENAWNNFSFGIHVRQLDGSSSWVLKKPWPPFSLQIRMEGVLVAFFWGVCSSDFF